MAGEGTKHGGRTRRSKAYRYPVVITEHAFDKVRSIDLSLREFFSLLDAGGAIVEQTVRDESSVTEVVLLVEWRRPLHVVVHVDHARAEERILTVYEPTRDQWSPGDTRRRRR